MSNDLSYPVNYSDTGKVILYADCNYLGKNNEIGFGSFITTEAWNASSIKIPSDKKVIVYKQMGFKGTSKVLTNDDNCLPVDWNNQIASIKVISNSLSSSLSDLLGDTGTLKGSGGLGISGTGSGGGGSGGGIGISGSGGGTYGSGTGVNIVIYDKCNLTGKSRSLGAGEYNTIPSGETLTISSIRIPANKRVQVFSGKNFTGNSTTFYTTQKCLLSNWNDKILSMKIIE